MLVNAAAIDCDFDIGGFVLRGKRWGNPGNLPVLALHGWLDNCASFDFLAPRMPQLDLICLDLAGHGLSDHRNHRGAYNIWQDVGEIFAVADQLGWQQFGLLGHSRGAVIATLAAGTFPERITHLGLLEGIYPHREREESAPATLAKSIADINRQYQRSRRHYPSFEEAIKAREQGMLPLSHKDARVLAKRGVKQSDKGYCWLYDNKLVAGSELRLATEQIDAFVDNIAAATLLVLAEHSFLVGMADFQQWLARHPRIVRAHVPGDHHCHMSQQAQRVADELNSKLW